jgi:hypothetical protein
MLAAVSPACAYTSEAVQDAEAILKFAEDRLAMATISVPDVERARYHLINMKYRAAMISQKRYCDDGVPVLRHIVDLLEAGRNAGTVGDIPKMIEAKTIYYKEAASCRSR